MCPICATTPQGPFLTPSPHSLPRDQWTTARLLMTPTFGTLVQVFSANGLLNITTGKSLSWLNSMCPKLPYIIFLPRNPLFCLYFLLVISSLPRFFSHLRGPPLPHIQWTAKSFWVYLWTIRSNLSCLDVGYRLLIDLPAFNRTACILILYPSHDLECVLSRVQLFGSLWTVAC